MLGTICIEVYWVYLIVIIMLGRVLWLQWHNILVIIVLARICHIH